MPETTRDVVTAEFHRTGDWWVDFGLVNLHEEIRARRDLLSRFCVEFVPISESTPNSYILSGAPEDVQDCLQVLKDEVVARDYFSYRSGKKGYFLDSSTFEPRLYEKTSPQLHLKKFFGGITAAPQSRTSLDRLPKDKQALLRDFVEANRQELELVDVERMSSTKDKIFVGELELKVGWDGCLAAGPRTCCLSGRSFKKLEDAKGYHYPALVAPDKMQTFYSGQKSKVQLGAPYALACIMAPLGLRYVLLDQKGTDFDYVYFVPVADTLLELSRVQTSWVPPQLQLSDNTKYCNFDRGELFTSYVNESLLAYLLAVYSRVLPIGLVGQQTEADEDVPEGFPPDDFVQQSRGISVVAFSDSAMKEFRGVGDLFGLFRRMQELGLPTSKAKAFLRSFLVRSGVKNSKIKTHPRETVSRRILYRAPIGDVLEQFLFDQGSVAHCADFYRNYTEGIQLMTATQLDLCENIGTIIGMAASNRKSIGVIYDFRNAKTKPQFLKALEMFQFNLGSHRGDPACFNSQALHDFIAEFLESPEWQEMKSTVVIKAVNHYQASSYAAAAKGGK